MERDILTYTGYVVRGGVCVTSERTLSDFPEAPARWAQPLFRPVRLSMGHRRTSRSRFVRLAVLHDYPNRAPAWRTRCKEAPKKRTCIRLAMQTVTFHILATIQQSCWKRIKTTNIPPQIGEYSVQFLGAAEPWPVRCCGKQESLAFQNVLLNTHWT